MEAIESRHTTSMPGTYHIFDCGLIINPTPAFDPTVVLRPTKTVTDGLFPVIYWETMCNRFCVVVVQVSAFGFMLGSLNNL